MGHSPPHSLGNLSYWKTTTWFKEKYQAWKNYAGVFSRNKRLLPRHTSNNKVGTRYYTQSKQRPLNSWQSVWALLWFVFYTSLFTFYIYDFGSHQQLCSQRVLWGCLGTHGLGGCMYIFNWKWWLRGDGKGNHSSCLTTQSHNHIFSGHHLCCLKWDRAQQLLWCSTELQITIIKYNK